MSAFTQTSCDQHAGRGSFLEGSAREFVLVFAVLTGYGLNFANGILGARQTSIPTNVGGEMSWNTWRE